MEEEAEMLAEKWRLEDEMEEKKKKSAFSGKGRTLSELQTQETEMTQGNQSSVIDTFYTSINSAPTPKKGDKADDIEPGVSSDDGDTEEHASDTEDDGLVRGNGQITSS